MAAMPKYFINPWFSGNRIFTKTTYTCTKPKHGKEEGCYKNDNSCNRINHNLPYFRVIEYFLIGFVTNTTDICVHETHKPYSEFKHK